MGSCGSSAKKDDKTSQGAAPKYGGKGVVPKKISDVKNPNITVMDKIYLFGGDKILMFDINAMKIEKAPTTTPFPVPQRTSCEYLKELNKIAILGGSIGGKAVTKGYILDPKNFAEAVELPAYPKPIRYTTLAFFDNHLFAVGGETDGQDPDNLLTDVYKIKVAPQIGTAWEKVCDLPMKRRSANVMVANGSIYVFGGYSGKGLRSTQIDVVDTKTGKATQEPYRLPLGVEGARMCWFGDDLLLIGGKRIDDSPDANVLRLDFEKKAIMSLR